MRANRPPADFRTGDNILKVPARYLNRILAAVRKIETVRGPNVVNTPDHLFIGEPRRQAVPPRVRPGGPSMVVGIVVAPEETSKRLSVKRVVYKNPPNGPVADADRPYKFDGEAFDCVPYPGFEAFDYNGFEIGEEPTPDDTYFDASMVTNDVGVIGPIPSGVTAQLVTVAVVLDDALLCVDDDVERLVAKPYDLRRTPFDGQTINGISYAYSTSQNRIVSSTISGSFFRSFQIVAPLYEVGSRILALKLSADATGDEDATWQDMNSTGRAWARDASTLLEGLP